MSHFFVQICRTCMGASQYCHYIWREGKPTVIGERLMAVLPQLHDLKNESLPITICSPCLEKLNIAYHFRQICITTERCLLNLSLLRSSDKAALALEEAGVTRLEDYVKNKSFLEPKKELLVDAGEKPAVVPKNEKLKTEYFVGPFQDVLEPKVKLFADASVPKKEKLKSEKFAATFQDFLEPMVKFPADVAMPQKEKLNFFEPMVKLPADVANEKLKSEEFAATFQDFLEPMMKLPADVPMPQKENLNFLEPMVKLPAVVAIPQKEKLNFFEPLVKLPADVAMAKNEKLKSEKFAATFQDEKEDYRCTKCGKLMSTKSSLRRHKLMAHTLAGDRFHNRIACEKTRCQKTSLQKQQAYSAVQIPKAVASMSHDGNLILNLQGKNCQLSQIQATERQYACMLCSYRCATSSQLDIHTAEEHTNCSIRQNLFSNMPDAERPCVFCFEWFSKTSELIEHVDHCAKRLEVQGK